MSDHYDARGRLLEEPDDEYPTESPGPWRVDHSGDLLDRNGRLIGAMLPECRPGDEHLVAAAPALRDALVGMVVGCPLCSRNPIAIEGVYPDGSYCAHCHAARAVLERVVGGER